MRLLTLSNCPLREELGSGYVALHYARGLREREHQVDLLGPEDFELWPGLRRGIRYRQALGMALRCLQRLCSARYDVVELYGAESWLAAALLARVPGRDFLMVSHSNGLETHCMEVMRGAANTIPGWRERLDRHLAGSAFRNVDAIVTVSDYDRRYAVRQRYQPSDRLLAIDNPLPEAYLGRELDLDRPPVVGFCGSWLPRKGVDLVQRDLPRFLWELPSWQLVLVGVGAGFSPGEHFPPDLLPRIQVVPFADRVTELPALYARFSILVMPSLYESFGLVAAEAMACGCALVASPVGFAAALRHGREAMLLEQPSSPALYQALQNLALDDRLRRRIAGGGHRRVQSLRWTDAVARLEAAYESWLGELRRHPAPPPPRPAAPPA